MDGPSLAPSPLSISLMAARTVQDRPGQYQAADSWYSSRKVAGGRTAITPPSLAILASRAAVIPPGAAAIRSGTNSCLGGAPAVPGDPASGAAEGEAS